MNSNFKRALALRSVVTVAEAAGMYGMSTRRMAVLCEDGMYQNRKTAQGLYLISLDDLLLRRGEPKVYPEFLNEGDDNDDN
jgi:hypothetical protein